MDKPEARSIHYPAAREPRQSLISCGAYDRIRLGRYLLYYLISWEWPTKVGIYGISKAHHPDPAIHSGVHRLVVAG